MLMLLLGVPWAGLGAVDQPDGLPGAGDVHAAVEPRVQAGDGALDGADDPRVVRARRLADQHQVAGWLHDLGPQRAELLGAEEGEGAGGRGVVRPVVGVVVEVGRRDGGEQLRLVVACRRVQPRQLAQQQRLELVLAGGRGRRDQGADALRVLLPRVRDEQHGRLRGVVEHVVRGVHKRADMQVRVAQPALLDPLAAGHRLAPPGARELDAHLARLAVSEHAEGHLGAIGHEASRRVDAPEAAERGGVEDAVVDAALGGRVTPERDFHRQRELLGLLKLEGSAKGGDGRGVDGLGPEPLLHQHRELLCPAHDAPPLGGLVIVKVERPEHRLTERLVVPVGAAVHLC